MKSLTKSGNEVALLPDYAKSPSRIPWQIINTAIKLMKKDANR